jgi:hypothetical protein
LQHHRQVAAAVLDILEIDCGAGSRTVDETRLEGTDAVQRSAVAFFDHFDVIGCEDRVADRDRRGQYLVQPLAGAQGEPGRLAFGDPTDVVAGKAVGLLFTNDSGGGPIDDVGHVLHSVAVVMGDERRDARLPEELVTGGHEHPAVPSQPRKVTAWVP